MMQELYEKTTTQESGGFLGTRMTLSSSCGVLSDLNKEMPGVPNNRSARLFFL
jgi:hypothetical protein